MDCSPVLLHITTAAPWRAALDLGSYVAPSLLGPERFIHLSSPEQVHLPANAIYAGRSDLILLVIDPTRLDSEIHWEPGDPTDPESMRFPHLCGPLPTAAVTSVVPWLPGADGFVAPTGLPHPHDLTARARTFEPSLVQRRAPAARSFAGGFSVRDPRVAASQEHNCLWLTGSPTSEEVRAAASEHLVGLDHQRVVLDGPLPDDLGWSVDEERIMVLDLSREAADTPPAGGEVSTVTTETMARLWRPQWRAVLPEAADTDIDDLVNREPLADVHVKVIDLAVLDGADPVSSAQLRIDGATAALEAVMTREDHRGQGLAGTVVQAAVARARAAGCDVLWLSAAADEWPREWYARLGFRDVGTRRVLAP